MSYLYNIQLNLIFFVFLFTSIFTFSPIALSQTQDLDKVSQSDTFDYCPVLFYAVMDQDAGAVRTHLKYGADPNVSLENCPLSAFKLKLPSSRNTDKLIFNSLLREDFFIDYPEGTTLLHIAAYFRAYGDYDIYNLLRDYEADESAMDANSNSPETFLHSKACVSPDDLQITSCLF